MINALMSNNMLEYLIEIGFSESLFRVNAQQVSDVN